MFWAPITGNWQKFKKTKKTMNNKTKASYMNVAFDPEQRKTNLV